MRHTKYLVTGGAGFIGANLVRRLVNQGADVNLILRPESNLWRLTGITNKTHIIHSDLRKTQSINKVVKKIRPDIIYHLAAYGAYSYQDDADKIFSTNIFGTLNLLNACKKVGFELFVNTGSSSEYGFKKSPMKESDLLEPNSHYAIAKATQTHLSSYYAEYQNLPIVTLRPFSVFGPYEEPGRLIPNIMKSFLHNTELAMVSKKIVRDFVFVDDYIDACLKTERLKKYPGEVFNIGSGMQTNFGKLISIFQDISKIEGKISWEKNQGKKWDTDFWQANINKAHKLLGFKPKHSLKQGLQKDWEWFKTNNQFYNEHR